MRKEGGGGRGQIEKFYTQIDQFQHLNKYNENSFMIKISDLFLLLWNKLSVG
jgi:hypothetical protein